MRTNTSARVLAALTAGIGFAAATTHAHISLSSPNGGEELTIGSVFTIEWSILIKHSQQNWDLWYSTESNSGDWISIAIDLPPGDFAAGSVHSFEWTVPDVLDDTVWVRVRMDNSGTDYFDVSASSFAIVPAPAPALAIALGGFAALTRRRRRA